MSIRVERHDVLLQVIFQELERLARSCEIAIDVRFIPVRSSQHSIVVRTDYIIMNVLNELVFVLLEVLSTGGFSVYRADICRFDSLLVLADFIVCN